MLAGNAPYWDRVVVPMTLRMSPLSTPIAYITRVPVDVFETVTTTDGSPLDFFDTYDYADVAGLNRMGNNKGAGATSGGMWRLSSAGPDRIQSYGGDIAEIGRNSVINNFGGNNPLNGNLPFLADARTPLSPRRAGFRSYIPAKRTDFWHQRPK